MTAEGSAYPRHGTFWRCGFRIDRLDDERFFFDHVRVRKGEWKCLMDSPVFDVMSDEDFADYFGRAYREAVFEQLEADLAVLAKLGRFYLDGPTGSPMYLPPWHAIRDAVERCEATQERP